MLGGNVMRCWTASAAVLLGPCCILPPPATATANMVAVADNLASNSRASGAGVGVAFLDRGRDLASPAELIASGESGPSCQGQGRRRGIRDRRC